MLTRITIPRPHVPYGPEGLTDDASDVHYLREVVRKIDNGHIVVGGSNVTATIRKLITDAADTIGSPDVLAESPVVPSTEAAAVLRAAVWLDARRDETWNGGTRRPSNFGRAAVELRGYARDLMKGASQ